MQESHIATPEVSTFAELAAHYRATGKHSLPTTSSSGTTLCSSFPTGTTTIQITGLSPPK